MHRIFCHDWHDGEVLSDSVDIICISQGLRPLPPAFVSWSGHVVMLKVFKKFQKNHFMFQEDIDPIFKIFRN